MSKWWGGLCSLNDVNKKIEIFKIEWKNQPLLTCNNKSATEVRRDTDKTPLRERLSPTQLERRKV